jgi:hypothetical protein
MTACAERLDATTDDADLESLGRQICELHGHLTAATGTWLEMVARFDREWGWAVDGVRSCAHWLSWRCGIGLNAAREHVRVARALENLPRIDAQLRAGRLSYSKVRAITRVATPEQEDGLLNAAMHSTGAQLERLIAGLRRAKSLDNTRAQHASRSLTWRTDGDGSLVIRARLCPEEGAVFLKGVEAAKDACAASGAEAQVTAEQAAADALMAMAETTLRCGPAAVSGGGRYLVQIATELDPLLRGSAGAAEETRSTCAAQIEDGPSLPRETLDRILCDSAALIVAHHKSMCGHSDDGSGSHRCGTTSMDVGRKTRTIPPALRRALFLRDHGCRFPGCTQKKFVDAHHIKHWSRGGPTALRNLILLCRHHHQLLHEGGYSMRSDRHVLAFYRPDGTLLPEWHEPAGGTTEAVPEYHTATITPETTVPDWNGDPLDLEYAVEVLSQLGFNRFGDVSAETFPPVPADPGLN